MAISPSTTATLVTSCYALVFDYCYRQNRRTSDRLIRSQSWKISGFTGTISSVTIATAGFKRDTLSRSASQYGGNIPTAAVI